MVPTFDDSTRMPAVVNDHGSWMGIVEHAADVDRAVVVPGDVPEHRVGRHGAFLDCPGEVITLPTEPGS